MAEDHDFRGKKPPGKEPVGKTRDTPVPQHRIYDPEVLREVTAEIEAKEDREKKPEESGRKPVDWVDLPKLPLPPPQESPMIWLLRQVKRLVVIFVVIYLAVWGVGKIRNKYETHFLDQTKTKSVPLPNPDANESMEDQELTQELDAGRSELASANIEGGAKALEDLAQKHSATVQGRKAMLALAATYRFQLNQPELAIHWYKSYLESDPNGKEAPATMMRLGDYLETLGRKAEARAVYEDLIHRFPDKPQTAAAKQGLDRTK